MLQKTNNVNMDAFYFKKYSRYVKQNANSKSAINLFLTLKKCRESCYIHMNSRYVNSFLRVLKHYKMNYETYKDEFYSYFIISKKSISEDVKHVFLLDGDYTDNDHRIMGKFLGYPSFINVREVGNMKEIGSINFHFMINKNKDKYKELIYGFRIPNNEINPKMITKMNHMMRKYRKCIQKDLSKIYPKFTIEMNVKLSH